MLTLIETVKLSQAAAITVSLCLFFFFFHFIKVGAKAPEELRSQPLMLGLFYFIFFFGSVSLDSSIDWTGSSLSQRRRKKKNGMKFEVFVKMLVWTF